MRAAEGCYCNARRYSAGVMPVARRNARVKLDCEENRQSRAIFESDAHPVAISESAGTYRRPSASCTSLRSQAQGGEQEPPDGQYQCGR